MKSLSPTQAAREAIRLRAYQLFREGWAPIRIAQALGVTRSAVSQWLSAVRARGEDALRGRSAPGAPPRLTPDQLAHLVTLLKQGAPAHGFDGEVWTAARVAQVIATAFGVTYSVRHVRRLLHRLHWSPQTPRTRDAKRDDAAIAHWRDHVYPALKKMPKRGPDPRVS